jgi:fatty acid desaturase
MCGQAGIRRCVNEWRHAEVSEKSIRVPQKGSWVGVGCQQKQGPRLRVALDLGSALRRPRQKKRGLVQTTTAGPSTTSFRHLALDVRAAGLLDRRPAYYGAKIGLTIAAFVAGWVAFVLVGNSWATLWLAVFFGLMFTQLGFIGHDAGHQQVCSSRRANRRLGLVVGNVLSGVCYGWWVPKHNAHHAYPNHVGRDPDIGDGLVPWAAVGEPGSRPSSFARFLERWQAPLFFPLMALRSFGLHVSGAQYLLGRRDRESAVEILLIALHWTAFFVGMFLVLSPLRVLAFVAVEEVVFSFYLGCSFAPNHKAMPIIPADTTMEFAARQILTARNISGGRVTTFMLGGLNYQIEHHLFPSMPRPNLRHAQELVRSFCLASGFDYCETSVVGSLGRIIRSLQAAGQACAVASHAS